MEKHVTCINCPVGCRMAVTLSDAGEFMAVTGNTCPRGAVYAKQECTSPERMITAVVPVEGSDMPLSVKTSRPVPKAVIADVMRELAGLRLSLPVTVGQVVLPDVLHTGADIVATRSLS